MRASVFLLFFVFVTVIVGPLGLATAQSTTDVPTPTPTQEPTTTAAPTTTTETPTTTIEPTTTTEAYTTTTTTSAPSADCPSKVTIFDPNSQLVNSVPQPTAVVAYDTLTSAFRFSVSASYLTEDYTWVIDFERMQRNASDIFQPNNCENRKESNFFYKQYDQYWDSAPLAYSPNALNNPGYPAYGPSDWGLYATSCSSIQYYRAFTFSELTSCRGAFGNKLVSVAYKSDVIEYTGKLYVTAFKPINKYDYFTSSSMTTFTYPFKVALKTVAEGISSLTGVGSLSIVIISLTTTDTGLLILQFETSFGSANPGDFLVMPSIFSSPVSASIQQGPSTISSGPCVPDSQNRCRQQWKVTSDAVYNDYSGTYTMMWGVNLCPNGVCSYSSNTISGGFKITLVPQQTQVINGTGFATSVNVLGADGVQKVNGFSANEVILVKSAIKLQPSDVNLFTSTINNAWLCYSVNQNFAPRYDPANGMYGCMQSYGTVYPIARLVRDKLPAVADANERAFNTTLKSSFSSFVFPYASTAGFSFSAKPISASTQLLYVQVETIVGSGAQQRRLHQVTNVNELSSWFTINPETLTTTTAKPLKDSKSMAPTLFTNQLLLITLLFIVMLL